MKKFKYDYSADSWENDLDEKKLLECKSTQKMEHILLMEKKAIDVANTHNFGSYSERLVFLDAFYKGYLAAHCYNDEESELDMSLTPLGGALK